MRKLFLKSLPVLLPVFFFLLVWTTVSDRLAFEISTDEGINLEKALLVGRDYPLYTEVWSDQPPLFTFFLAAAIKFVGVRVETLRLLITMISSALLFAAYEYLRAISGTKTAVIGVILIALLPTYLILSVSIMIGLTSISFAVISLMFLTFWHRKRKYSFILLSALFLGLSISIKLITGLLAPIFILGLAISELMREDRSDRWIQTLLPALIWGGIFTVVTLLIGLVLVGIDNIPQLITNHLGASSTDIFQSDGEFKLSSHLGPSYPYLFLALLSGFYAIARKKWVLLYPFAWMVTAFVLLAFHSPVWYHHVILITIPAAILAAEIVVIGIDGLRRLVGEIAAHWNFADWLHLATIIGLLILFFRVRPPDLTRYMTFPALRSESQALIDPETSGLLERVAEYKSETKWMLTDRPMYAFRNGILVPPEFAVLSLKRMITGEVTEEDLIEGVVRYKPEQVLIARYSLPNLENHLSQEYTLSAEYELGMKLYIRSDHLIQNE